MKWSLRTKGLLPVEKVVVAYLTLTFALIAVFSVRLSGVFPHLAFRVLLIVIILLLPWLEKFVLSFSQDTGNTDLSSFPVSCIFLL